MVMEPGRFCFVPTFATQDKSPEAKRTAIDQGTSTTPASHTSRGISDGSPQETRREGHLHDTARPRGPRARRARRAHRARDAPPDAHGQAPQHRPQLQRDAGGENAGAHVGGHLAKLSCRLPRREWAAGTESPPIVGSQTLWATYRASESDEAQLALAQQNLHHAVRGMPEIADRLTQRWARKTERGLQNALREYKDVTQLPDRPRGRAHGLLRPRRSAESSRSTKSETMRSSVERAVRCALSARRLQDYLRREIERSGALFESERGPHHRAAKDQVRKSSPEKKMGAVPADLFEIPEQLREAKRRTAELESQLAELRKRLQLQENRSLTARTLVASAGSLAINPPAIALRPGDVYYLQPPEHGSRTPTRYSLGAPAGPQQVDTPAPQAAPAPRAVHAVHAVHAAALTARSLSPTPAPGTVNGAWTWPGHLGRGGAIYAAPAGVASPTRVASPGAYVASPPRVASPVRFIQGQTPNKKMTK
eukprot:g24053.t1